MQVLSIASRTLDSLRQIVQNQYYTILIHWHDLLINQTLGSRGCTAHSSTVNQTPLHKGFPVSILYT
jgi:hypothetical protein